MFYEKCNLEFNTIIVVLSTTLVPEKKIYDGDVQNQIVSPENRLYKLSGTIKNTLACFQQHYFSNEQEVSYS